MSPLKVTQAEWRLWASKQTSNAIANIGRLRRPLRRVLLIFPEFANCLVPRAILGSAVHCALCPALM